MPLADTSLAHWTSGKPHSDNGRHFIPGDGGVIPNTGLMGMYHWMGSHFRDWIDYNGVASSTSSQQVQQVPDSYSNGVANCRDFGGKKSLARFAIKKKYCYRKNCSAVDLVFTSRITFHFEIAIKRLYVRFMNKQRQEP